MPDGISFKINQSFTASGLPVIPYTLTGAPASRARFLATVGTTDTDAVPTWTSVDGALSMAPSGGTAPGKSTINGTTVVRFNGTSSQLQVSLAQARPHSFAAAFYVHALPASEGIVVGGRSTISSDPAVGDGGTLSIDGAGSWIINAGSNGSWGTATVGWHTAVVTFGETTTSGRIDGTTITRDVGLVPRKILTLGGHRGAYYTNVSVAELVAWDGALTTAQAADIEAAMRKQYGL